MPFQCLFYVFNNVKSWNSASSQEELGVQKTPPKNGLTKIIAIGYEVPKVRMTEYQVFLKNTFPGRSQTDVFEQNKPIAFVQANLSENNAC